MRQPHMLQNKIDHKIDQTHIGAPHDAIAVESMHCVGGAGGSAGGVGGEIASKVVITGALEMVGV